MTITREPLTPSVTAELRPLILANHDATGRDEPFAPEWPLLYDMAGKGSLCLLVARSNGSPVGYCAHAYVNNHGTGQPHAVCVAIYLLPRHRGKAQALVRMAEAEARTAGCTEITFHLPHESRAAPFLEHLGYGRREVVMGRRL